MWETSARLLKLLSLLQARRDWTGSDLATRLGVSERTVRRDVDRLRELGYPVDASRGTDGGYRLGTGANMPPLLLDDDEAVATLASACRDHERLRFDYISYDGTAAVRTVEPHRLVSWGRK